ncbi:MAG: DUF3080 family protein [Pseudomonadota bacterium]
MASRAAFIACVLVATAGCGQTENPEAAFLEYELAVAEALELAVTPVPAERFRYPGRPARKLVIEPVRLDLDEFWGFQRCGLRTLIAEHNTILGRAESDFLHAPYEHELRVTLVQCRGTVLEAPEAANGATGSEPLADDDAEEFVALIDEVLERKEQEQDAFLWNLTFGSREFAGLFASAAAPLAIGAESPYAPTAEIEHLASLIDGFGDAGFNLDVDALVDTMRELEVGRFGGTYFESLTIGRRGLERINAQLATVNERTLCPMSSSTRRARELESAFRWHYVRTLQPWLAALSRAGDGWFRATAALFEEQQHVMPESFAGFARAYLDPEAADGVFSRQRQAIAEHAGHWQRIFKSCGIPLVYGD